MGAIGEMITKSDEERLEEHFAKAVELARLGRSVALNLIIGKTDFRKGSISI